MMVGQPTSFDEVTGGNQTGIPGANDNCIPDFPGIGVPDLTLGLNHAVGTKALDQAVVLRVDIAVVGQLGMVGHDG